MKLDRVVPWGRSFAEYLSMFNLTESELGRNLLGCGDGPASFNKELTTIGGNVVSVDPVYEFTAAQIRSRIESVYPRIMAEMEKSREKYVWKRLRDVKHLGEVRMRAMKAFLADYESGFREGRYVKASLPDLPFTGRQFDLALCSHLLFLYSDQIDVKNHIAGMKELCRVAGEVRVYPLVALGGGLSPHVEPVTEALEEAGISVSLEHVEYEFQKGATKMLVARNSA